MINIVKTLCTVALCCLAFSLSAQSHVGKWKFEFPTEDGQGTMVMIADIKADGTYALDFGDDGSVEITGTYTVSGDKFTIKDNNGDCTGTGVYTITATDTTLTMTQVSDECSGRGNPNGPMVAARV